jgi:hypothetical protein
MDKKDLNYGLNAKYNCDVNICLEDILNLKHCLDKTFKEVKLDAGVDFFPFTIKAIIIEWERIIGKATDEILKEK